MSKVFSNMVRVVLVWFLVAPSMLWAVTEMTLVDRVDLTDMGQPGMDRFRQEVFKEIDNLKQLYRSMDMEAIRAVVELLHNSPGVFVVGSRLSYTLAYYFGWQLTKIRTCILISSSG